MTISERLLGISLGEPRCAVYLGCNSSVLPTARADPCGGSIRNRAGDEGRCVPPTPRNNDRMDKVQRSEDVHWDIWER